MTERKTSRQRSINGIDYVPDVGIVCWNVILASGIKIFFSAIHWRLDSLVLSPQLPPLGVVVLFSNSSTEKPSNSTGRSGNRTAGTPPSSVPSSLRRLYQILKRHSVKTSTKLSLVLSACDLV